MKAQKEKIDEGTNTGTKKGGQFAKFRKRIKSHNEKKKTKNKSKKKAGKLQQMAQSLQAHSDSILMPSAYFCPKQDG